MPSITHFDIYKPAEPCNLTGEALRETMEKTLVDCLSEDGKEFNLKGYCIGSNGLEVIASDERLTMVKRLNFGGNRLGDEGMKILAEAKVFSKVNWLELGGNDLGPEGIRSLVGSKVLAKVKTLNLYRNYVKDEGAVIMAKYNRLEKLEELDLAHNEIGDPGLLALANSKAFPNLVACYIDNNFASMESKEEAKASANFKKLQSLNM